MQFSQRNRPRLMQKRFREKRRIKGAAIKDRWRSERRRQKRRREGGRTVRARVLLAGGRRRSLRVERADALSDVSYRNYASDRSRAQISRNLGALHSTAVSIPRPPPCPAPLAPQTLCIQSPPPSRPLSRSTSQLQRFPNRYLLAEPRRTFPGAPKFTYTCIAPSPPSRPSSCCYSSSSLAPRDRLYPLLAARYRRFDYFLQA